MQEGQIGDNKVKVLSLLANIFLWLSLVSAHEVGFKELELIPDAYIGGNGSAAAADLSYPQATNINPAALGTLTRRIHINLSHSEYFLGTKYESILVALNLSKFGNAAIGIRYFYTDKMNIVLSDGTQVSEVFDATALCFLLSYARALTEKTYIGVNVKPIVERLYKDSAAAIAYDIGLLYCGLAKSIDVGFSLRNIAAAAKFVEKEVKAPMNLRCGIRCSALAGTIKALIDIIQQLDGHTTMNVGIQYKFLKNIFLRCGFQTATNLISVGATLNFDIITIDYSHYPNHILGMIDYFTVNINF